MFKFDNEGYLHLWLRRLSNKHRDMVREAEVREGVILSWSKRKVHSSATERHGSDS